MNGAHQCDFLNFFGAHAPTLLALAIQAELPAPSCLGSVVAVTQTLLKMPPSHERWIGPKVLSHLRPPAPATLASNPIETPAVISLHNAPILRLLLKIAMSGMHQCDFLNLCEMQAPTNTRIPFRQRMEWIICFSVDDTQACRPNVAKRLAGSVHFRFVRVPLQRRTCEAGGSIALCQ